MATSTNARFPRPLVVSCNLGLIFVVLDIISVSHNNISLTKISTAFWEKGNNPTCRVDAVQIKQIAPWFHSVDPPSSSCKNHPSTAVIGWPHWVPSLCFLWQLTHTVALVMYIFLEVYFMSFSSAGNADVFGLHIGLLLRHSCHSWLQECLWARRVEQTGTKDVGVFTGATTAPNPLHHQIPTVHSFQGKPLQSQMCSWNPSFLFWSVGCTLINLNFCSAEDLHKWMTSRMLIQLYLYSFLSENLRWHA